MGLALTINLTFSAVKKKVFTNKTIASTASM